jgi:hypothetical protein
MELETLHDYDGSGNYTPVPSHHNLSVYANMYGGRIICHSFMGRRAWVEFPNTYQAMDFAGVIKDFLFDGVELRDPIIDLTKPVVLLVNGVTP